MTSIEWRMPLRVKSEKAAPEAITMGIVAAITATSLKKAFCVHSCARTGCWSLSNPAQGGHRK